jgi:hypothetical protein
LFRFFIYWWFFWLGPWSDLRVAHEGGGSTNRIPMAFNCNYMYYKQFWQKIFGQICSSICILLYKVYLVVHGVTLLTVASWRGNLVSIKYISSFLWISEIYITHKKQGSGELTFKIYGKIWLWKKKIIRISYQKAHHFPASCVLCKFLRFIEKKKYICLSKNLLSKLLIVHIITIKCHRYPICGPSPFMGYSEIASWCGFPPYLSPWGDLMVLISVAVCGTKISYWYSKVNIKFFSLSCKYLYRSRSQYDNMRCRKTFPNNVQLKPFFPI